MNKLLHRPLGRWNLLWTALLTLSILGSLYVDESARNQRPSVSFFRDGVTSRVEQIVRQENANLPLAEQRKIARKVVQVSKLHKIDPILVLAVIKVESAFRPQVVSYAGAIGLMQVKPIVVWELSGQRSSKREASLQLKNPLANIEIGVQYLSYLRERFGDQNWYHVLAAYNMGPTLVGRQVRKQKNPSRRYFAKVMKAYRNYSQNTGPAAI